MENSNKVAYRVSPVVGGFMVALAVIADLFQVLLTLTGIFAIAGTLVSFFTLTILGVWFTILRVSFIEGRRGVSKFLTVLTTSVAEIIPFVGGLPTLTIGTILTIRISRQEDRKG